MFIGISQILLLLLFLYFLFHYFIYSFRANQAWSFRDNAFSFDPVRGNFDVAGVQFQWNDGIFSITLSNRNSDGFKTAYFHSMASTSEFSVSTQVLRNQTFASRSYHGQDFRVSKRILMFWVFLLIHLHKTKSF